MRTTVRAAAAVALVAVVSAVSVGCSTASLPTADAAPRASGAEAASGTEGASGVETSDGVDAAIVQTIPYRKGDVRVAVVGDSLTAGGARYISQGLDANTWMTYAQGRGIAYVGGFAEGGTTIQDQVADVKPVPDVDVLVLMSGTNDVRLGFPFEQVEAYYQQVVSVIKPKRVIIGAIPPYDLDPDGAATYERALESFVEHDTNWTFVDPWRFARAGKVYAGGLSNDGIHPTTSGYKTLGANFRAAILRVAGAHRLGSPRNKGNTSG